MLVICFTTNHTVEHRINEEIFEEARVVPIVMGMRRRRLEWFGHVRIRDETGTIRAVAQNEDGGEAP